jgi:hypothetical protein
MSETTGDLNAQQARRSFWGLVGLLALHFTLGVICLVISGLVFLWKVGLGSFVQTAPGVLIVFWLAFGMYWIAAGVLVWHWRTRRRRAWRVSVVWLVVSLTAVIAVIAAVQPAGYVD